MLLAIDAGNTNIVFAMLEGQKVEGSWRASTNARSTADEYAVWLTQLMALNGMTPADVDAVIVSCVVPDLLFTLATLTRRYFGTEAMIVGDRTLDLGIRVVIDHPEEAGADRLVNAIAARSLVPPPLIVVDFGTATTFDVIDTQGDFAGGVIAPGINLSLDALSMAAAKLPRVAIRKTEKIIGTGTIGAMQSGIFWGYIGLIEGLLTRIRAELGGGARVLSTGGLAPLFAGATTMIERVEPDLTVLGLRLIYERNTQS